MGEAVGDHRGGSREVLLLDGAVEGVLVAEDDVHLVGAAALIGAEHDGVGRVAVERLGGEVAPVAVRNLIAPPQSSPSRRVTSYWEHETRRGVEGLREEGKRRQKDARGSPRTGPYPRSCPPRRRWGRLEGRRERTRDAIRHRPDAGGEARSGRAGDRTARRRAETFQGGTVDARGMSAADAGAGSRAIAGQHAPLYFWSADAIQEPMPAEKVSRKAVSPVTAGSSKGWTSAACAAWPPRRSRRQSRAASC